jgi:hypothetical protein
MGGDMEGRIRRLERGNGALPAAPLVGGGVLGWRGVPAEVVRADRVEVSYLKGDGGLTFHGPDGEVRARYPGG